MTKQLTEEEFEEQFHPITKNNEGELFEWADVQQLLDPWVWTVVETGDPINDSWYALPGFHRVNKLGYLRSETPWTDGDVEALWFERWPELQNYDPDHRRYVVEFPGLGIEVHLQQEDNGEVLVLDGEGEDVSEEIRSAFEASGRAANYEYMIGEYLRLVAEAYAAALTDDEAETRSAAVAALNVPLIIPKED